MLERAVVSTKNNYYISKHRYYELRHFCRQYGEWTKELESMAFVISARATNRTGGREFARPTEELVEKRDRYQRKIDLIGEACLAADPCIGRYIFVGVTEGLSYEVLRARMDVPCGKRMYYDYLRKFFWILDKAQESQLLICK